MSACWSRAWLTARRIAEGQVNWQSASVISSQGESVRARPFCIAWFLPHQPSGRWSICSVRTRGSSAARASTISAVRSSLRSLTTTSSKSG